MSIETAIQSHSASVKTVIDELAISARKDANFLLCPETGNVMSFAQMQSLSSAFEANMRDNGVAQGAKVAILMDNGIVTAQLFLSIMYTGMVAVPLNCADSPIGWRRILDDCEADAVLVSPNYKEQLDSCLGLSSTLRVFEYSENTPNETISQSTPNETSSQSADNDTGFAPDTITSCISDTQSHANLTDHDALIAYTSGSTGKPKGGLFTHHNLLVGGLNTVHAHELNEHDVSLLVLPLYHMNAQIVTLMSTLISGGSVIVPKNFSAHNFWQQVRMFRCTWFALVPTIISQLVHRAEATNFDAADVLHHVRFARSSSAPLNPGLNLRFEEIFQMPMLEAMGMTEAGGAIFSNPLPPLPRKVGSPGLPFGFEAIVVDDAGIAAPPGQPGELRIKGESVMRGYFRQDVLTRAVLHDDGYLNTGDIARIDEDGYIFIIGRTSEVIRKGAEKISPREIEDVLLKHSSVAEAAVIGVPEPHWGNEIVGFVTFVDGQKCSETELLDFCRRNLGILKAPRAVVTVAEFPRAAAHKINKKALHELAPKFDELSDRVTTFSQTDIELESQIRTIWSQHLKQTDVAATDDFFALGGTSLIATAIAAQLKDQFNVDIGLHGFFEKPTVRQQAEAISNTKVQSQLPPHTQTISSQFQPLSSAQERVWLFEQITPGTAVYNESEAVILRGQLNVDAFRKAIEAVTRRHNILRSRFKTVNGKPVQFIFEKTIEVPLVRIENVSDSLEKQINDVIQRPFKFDAEHLVRFVLFEQKPDDHVFLLVMHHLVCDRTSIGIFLREVSEIYSAQAGEKGFGLRPLTMQFADFAVRQKTTIDNQENDAAKSFWTDRLNKVAPTLNLPTDRRRPPEPTYNGTRVNRELKLKLTQSIERAAKSFGVTQFEFMASALATLLHKYTHHQCLALALPIDKRVTSDLLPMIGFFADTHFLTFEFPDEQTVKGIIKDTHSELASTRRFSQLPLEEALKEMPRALRNREFMPVLVNQRNAQDRLKAIDLYGIDAKPLSTYNSCSKFEITFAITFGDQQLSIEAEYNSDLFDPDTIERMLTHFENLLEQFSTTDISATKLSELSILTSSEIDLFNKINDNRKAYPDLAVHEIFRQRALETPNAIAVQANNTQLTYRELDERTEHVALLLHAHGVRNGSLVGMFLNRSEDIVIAMLGILKSGAAYVPLDSQYPKERLKYMIDDAQISTVLTHGSIEFQLPGQANLNLIRLDQTNYENVQTSELQNSKRDLEALAYVTYTSGSTGKPKGVEIPHKGILRLLFGNDYANFGNQERILHHSAVTFDLTTFEVWAPLLHGGTCVVHTERSTDVSKLAESIEQQNITTMWLTASLYNELIAQYPQKLKGLKQLIMGGEALSVHHTVLGLKELAQTSLVNGYGPTENTTLTTCFKIPKNFSLNEFSVPIGKPLNGTTVHVVDKHMQRVPIGVSGELLTGGDGIARGYHNQRDLTEEKFIPSPFVKGDRLYRTGDSVRILPDGNIEFLGRIDEQVKVRGFRIEPGEIDKVLNQHADVSATVTIVRDDTPTGRALVSYVVIKYGAELSTTILRDYLRNYLPPYMVPSYIVQLPAIPTNPSGKTDKSLLPKPQPSALRDGLTEPKTPTEEIILGLMAETLGQTSLSTTNDFFDEGGHSLLALQFIDGISNTYKLDIPVSALFDNPTTQMMAQYVDKALHLLSSSNTIAQDLRHSLIPIKPGGSHPPLFFTPGGDGTESAFLVYAKLARLMKEVPFFGLRARGVAYGIEPHVTVEAMARDYLQEVRRQQPSGPYYFAGECVGGVIAYEMARQAQETGEEIGLLLLLDCRPPSAAQNAGKRIKWAWNRLSTLASRALSKNGSEPAPLEIEPETGDVHTRDTEVDAAVQSSVKQSNALSLKDLMWLSYQKTLLRYRPKPYKGDMVLLLNEDYSKLNLPESWKRFVSGNVDTIVVSGDHSSYIREYAT